MRGASSFVCSIERVSSFPMPSMDHLGSPPSTKIVKIPMNRLGPVAIHLRAMTVLARLNMAAMLRSDLPGRPPGTAFGINDFSRSHSTSVKLPG